MHGAQRRTDDQLEAHVGRGRVARQPEHRRAVHQTESLGLARAHVHRGHLKLAQIGHDRLDEIVVAVGRATRGHHEVVLARGRIHGRAQSLVGVLHDGKDVGHRPGPARAGGHGIAVGIADLAGTGHLGGRHQLAARGNDGHARTPAHRNLQHAAAGQKAHARSADHLAGSHDHLAGPSLLACGADVGPHLRRRRERHRRARAPVAFHHGHDLVLHHGIGVVGQAGAGHDAHALPRSYDARKHISGTDLGNHAQGHGRLFGGRADFGGPQGKAVHGRMGEGGHVDVARQIGRSHSAHSIKQPHLFHIRRRHSPAHERASLLQRDHVLHCLPFPQAARKAALAPIRPSAPGARKAPRRRANLFSLLRIIAI